MDTMSLLQFKDKYIYLCGISNTIPVHSSLGSTIKELNTNILAESESNFVKNTIEAVKPNAIILQIDDKRGKILNDLEKEKIENNLEITNQLIYEKSMKWFKKEYSLVYETFARSQSVINPFELFNLLLNKSIYDILHIYSKQIDNCNVVYCDNGLNKNLKQFSKSLEKMYSFDDVRESMMQDMSSGMPNGMPNGLPNIKDLHKVPPAMLKHLTQKDKKLSNKNNKSNKNKMLKNIMDNVISKRPKSIENETNSYKNDQLLEMLNKLNNENEKNGQNIDLNALKDIYNRENCRTIINELKECMPVCVDTLLNNRNDDIIQTLLQDSNLKDAKTIVAVVNIANMDAIENKFEKL